MRVLAMGALGIAAALAAGLYASQPGQAQALGSAGTPEIELYNSARTAPRFSLPQLGRRASIAHASAMASGFAAAPPLPARQERQIAEELVPRPHLLQHFFLSGIACLVRGDPAGAAEVFLVTDEIAADLPQMHYLLAMARVLSDFQRRAQALPLIQRAIAADPQNPLYAIVDVLADANLSVLKPDGALYFTPAGAQLIRAAGSRLPTAKDAYNGKYFVVLLAALETTGEAALPQRLNGFAAMLGQGRKISLPQVKEPQALGRLLVLAISETQLAPYEARFLGGATGGREAFAFPGPEQRRTDLASRSSILVP